ncbi:MAG: hypothetical protein ACJ74Z_22135 [Bryobacteraceae bacterium]
MSEVDLGAEALWTLALVSALAGLTMLYVFRHWSDQDALRATTNRMLAHFMEFRLFVDEPPLVIRAQRDLFFENWHLLKLLARPSLILIVPSIILFTQMDACYSRAPLRIGEAAVITVQLKNFADATTSPIVLKAPATIRVESPGVRVEGANQISWRIRPIAALSGRLEVIGPERAVTKSIVAGEGLHYVAERRVSSLPAFLLHLNEPPLLDSSIASIDVFYAPATILHLHWLVWFLAVSCTAAIVVSVLPSVVDRIRPRIHG